MYVSLYYTAKRDHPISKQEQEDCQKVVERYITKFLLKDKYESFCVYDLGKTTEENVIFEGATKLPLDQDDIAKVYDYWEACLQEIIYLLPGAQWHIHVDDADVTAYFDYQK